MARPPLMKRLMKTEAMHLIGRIAWLVGSRFGGSLLTLVYTLIIARIASPETFGLAMLGLSWALLASIPLSLNVEGGSVKYLTGYHENGNPEKASGFLRFNLNILVFSTALVLVGIGLAWVLGWLDTTTVSGRVALFAALAAPVLANTRVYGRHATALDRVLLGSLPRMLVRPALFCLVLGGLWIAERKVEADLIMGLFLLASVLTAALQTWLLRGTFGFARSAAPDMTERRAWVETGLMLAPLLLMRDNLKNIIVLCAGFVLPVADVGLLALSLSILSIVIFAIKSVDIAISPRLSRAIQGDRPAQAMTYLGGSAALKLVGTGVGLGAVALFGEQLIGAFGTDYSSARTVTLILFAIPIADALFGPTDMVLNVTGNRRSILIVSIWSFVLLVLGTMAGGQLGGLTGAAWGAAIPYMVQQGALCLQCIRQADIDPSLRSILALRRPKGG